MFQHFILVASSYAEGRRIGFHMSSEGNISKDIIEEIMKRINSLHRNDLGVHFIMTESKEWKSIVELDSFFEDVLVCADFEEFTNVLVGDLKITALDVAKFFLSFKPLSQLQIQKLVYLAYREYLVDYNQKLFDEKIVAYRYGPVVEEIYQIFKKYGSYEIELEDTCEYVLKNIHLPQAIGRLFLAENHKQIISTLLRIIEKYGDMTGSQLVKLTHTKGGAWDSVYVEGMNCEITDTIILAKEGN